MSINIRRAETGELDLLQNIEKNCFPTYQQSSRRTLRLSLNSPFQMVWIAEHVSNGKKKPVGCLIVHLHKRSLRVFSIAVLPSEQGKGIGLTMINYIKYFAVGNGYERISLEADSKNTRLISWYNKQGFESKEEIPDYYEVGYSGVRMVLPLDEGRESQKVANILVVNDPESWKMNLSNVQVVSARAYTADIEFYSRKNLRIFNLCDSYRYQSMGYYVSLLASARDHRAIPNVTTIRDFRDGNVIQSLTEEIEELIQKTLKPVKKSNFELDIYFGKTIEDKYLKLGFKIYQLFEAPLIRVYFAKSDKWEVRRIKPISLSKIDEKYLSEILHFATEYFKSQRFHRKRLKPYAYDLAVLVNPEESHPPSNKKALKSLKKAAENEDVYLEFIEKQDLSRISEFDALFIRTTTNVNDYTYQFARKAYAEGLIVIDDPWSILRCSNKIYLNERLRINNLNTPQTYVFFKNAQNRHSDNKISYPVILKQPDSSFSRGVLKANNEQELKDRLKELFHNSDLIIGQAFMPTEFDWRIGILDSEPLFACKYYMAAGHWQIYDWKSQEKDPSGKAETLELTEVPDKVLQTAVKAAALMGDGLYGVDLKEINGQVYVIEVNDNPNIEAGIEDHKTGRDLYVKIIKSFKRRIEMAKNTARFVSIEPN